jgi:XTP/dITP diphosphohydrolase
VRVIVASRNAHKIEELTRMAPRVQWTAMDAALGDPPETGATFEENALQKARYVYERTGAWALADDSGLEVDALGGRPGVRSKRYSALGTDSANNALLVEELGGASDRRARYRCVIALVGPGVERVASGACEGSIGWAPRGSGGFGYDPYFVPAEGGGRHMAELSPAEKDAISHRGAAMRVAMEWEELARR